MNFCSGMPLRKVHELAFLWFGLPGPLLITSSALVFPIRFEHFDCLALSVHHLNDRSLRIPRLEHQNSIVDRTLSDINSVIIVARTLALGSLPEMSRFL